MVVHTAACIEYWSNNSLTIFIYNTSKTIIQKSLNECQYSHFTSHDKQKNLGNVEIQWVKSARRSLEIIENIWLMKIWKSLTNIFVLITSLFFSRSSLLTQRIWVLKWQEKLLNSSGRTKRILELSGNKSSTHQRKQSEGFKIRWTFFFTLKSEWFEGNVFILHALL